MAGIRRPSTTVQVKRTFRCCHLTWPTADPTRTPLLANRTSSESIGIHRNLVLAVQNRAEQLSKQHSTSAQTKRNEMQFNAIDKLLIINLRWSTAVWLCFSPRRRIRSTRSTVQLFIEEVTREILIFFKLLTRQKPRIVAYQSQRAPELIKVQISQAF